VKLSDDYGTKDFSYYPEVVKPMLIAGTDHYNSSNREKWGYGVPHMNALELMIDKKWFETDYFKESNSTQSYSFSVTSGTKTRLALHWLSDVTSSDFSDTKDAQSDIDLDLSVDYPGSSVSSWKYDTSVEFVEFTPDSDGTATVEVHNFRWDGSSSSRPMGLAWYKEY